MKKTLLAFAIFALAGMGNSLFAASVCPANAFSAQDCAYIITIAPDGSFSLAATGGGAYDSSFGDDVLVGVINNSASVFQGTIDLSSGTDIFGFENDGYCTLNSAGPCGSTGYEGPLNTFTNYVIVPGTSGTVDFSGGAGIGANGGTTWFSLEEGPSQITDGGGITVGTPEPATFAMIGGGLGLLALVRRRKK